MSSSSFILLTLLLLFLLFLFDFSPCPYPLLVSASIPAFPSAGAALSFDSRRSDILSLLLPEPPLNFTIEFWVKVANPLLATQTVLSIGGFDGANAPGFDRPLLFHEFLQSDGLAFWAYNNYISCQNSQQMTADCFPPSWIPNHWFHMASVYESDGQTNFLTVYQNGVLLNSLNRIAFTANPFPTNACFYLGQNLHELCNFFDSTQSFSGVLDEFRFWSSARSASEIQANYLKTHIQDKALLFQWRFDRLEMGGTQAADTSGNGLVGQLGQLPITTVPMMYFDSISQSGVKPTAPQWVISDAPCFDSSSMNSEIVVFAASPTSTMIQIHVLDMDGTSGTMTMQMTFPAGWGTVALTPGTFGVRRDIPIYPTALGSLAGFYPNATLWTATLYYSVFNTGTFTSTQPFRQIDFFNVTATNSAGSIMSSIRILRRPAAEFIAANTSTTILENSQGNVLTLGGIDDRGNSIPAVITQFPQGKLYQVEFLPFTNYTEMDKSHLMAVPDSLYEITPAKPIVLNPQGVVIYVPDPLSSASTNLQYSWVVSESTSLYTDVTQQYVLALNSSNQIGLGPAITMNLTVSPVTIPPVVSSFQVEVSDDLALIHLAATDVNTEDVINTFDYFFIDQFPTQGSIYQLYNASNPLVAFFSKQSVGSQFLSTASLSSSSLLFVSDQLSDVESGGTLVQYVSTTMYATTEDDNLCTTNLNCAKTHQCCVTTSTCGCLDKPNLLINSAQQLRGAPDCYPTAGDCSGAWTPYYVSDHIEFVDLAFEYAVFLSSIEIFESYNPGAVVRVDVAAQYISPNATSWVNVWEGEAAAETLGYLVARDFQPTVCPAYVKMQYIRLWLDTRNAYYGRHEIDAVKVYGTINPPVGQLMDPAGNFFYQSKPGVHAAASDPFDTLTFSASNCLLRSSSATLSIYKPAPSDTANATFNEVAFQTQQIALTPGQNNLVSIDISAVQADYAAAKGQQLSSSLITATLHGLFGATQLPSQAAASSSSKVRATSFTQFNGSPITNINQEALNGLRFVANVVSNEGAFTMRVWLTTPSWVYRIHLQFVMNCSAGLYSDMNSGLCLPCSQLSLTQRSLMPISTQASCLNEETILWPARAAVLVATAACAMTVLLSLSLLVNFRNSSILRAISPIFVGIIHIGCLLALSTVFVLYPEPTDFLCSAQIWMGHMAFALVFGSLFIRTWRVASIFTALKLAVQRRKGDMQLLMRISMYWLAVGLLLTAWQLTSAPYAVEMWDLGSGDYQNSCTSDNYTFKWVLVGLHGALLGWALYLSIQARDAPKIFSDAQQIALCLYNVGFISLVLLLIHSLATLTADGDFFLTSIGLILGAMVSITILGFYYIYLVYQLLLQRRKYEIESRSGSSTISQGSVVHALETLWSQLQGAVSKMHVAVDLRNFDEFQAHFESINAILVAFDPQKKSSHDGAFEKRSQQVTKLFAPFRSSRVFPAAPAAAASSDAHEKDARLNGHHALAFKEQMVLPPHSRSHSHRYGASKIGAALSGSGSVRSHGDPALPGVAMQRAYTTSILATPPQPMAKLQLNVAAAVEAEAEAEIVELPHGSPPSVAAEHSAAVVGGAGRAELMINSHVAPPLRNSPSSKPTPSEILAEPVLAPLASDSPPLPPMQHSPPRITESAILDANRIHTFSHSHSRVAVPRTRSWNAGSNPVTPGNSQLPAFRDGRYQRSIPPLSLPGQPLAIHAQSSPYGAYGRSMSMAAHGQSLSARDSVSRELSYPN